jgi:hypothetical protein
VPPTRLPPGDVANSCLDVIDVVFWNQQVYDCQQNRQAAGALITVLSGHSQN